MPRRSTRPPAKRARSPSPEPATRPTPPTRRRGGTPAAALAPTPATAPALPKPVSLARTAGPTLAPSTATGAFVPADFAAAASTALTTLRAAVGGCRPLDAATALAAAGLVTPPPRPTRMSRAPPRASETHAAPRGPGGGRPLRPGRDILITISVSDAAKPAKPALDAVFVGGEELTWRKVVEAAPCGTPAALARLGHRATGAYVAMEGAILVDGEALRTGGADYAAPLLALLALAGVSAPAPPPRPAPEAGPLRGRPPPAEDTPWRTGDWGERPLAASVLRCGGGGGGVFGHAGACEHALSIRDVRLATASDASGGVTTGDFPIVVARAQSARGRKCGACRRDRAARAVWACADAPGDPSFWCWPCYEAFFYDCRRELSRDHRVVVYEGG